MTDDTEPTNLANRSGGADLNAQGDIHIAGDVVGRDKVVNTQNVETGGGAYIGGDVFVASGGEFVGRDKIVYEAPAIPVDMLHQLPAPPGDFTGRTVELAELRERFEQGVTISGLQGQGGVGKTALALCLAAQLVKRYPDAQIFLDVKGVSDSPLTASEIMAHVVHSFQPTAKLPDNEAELKAAYRSALYKKRVLLVLDNARDAEQIKPLLPAPAGCGVIVTSRLHFHVPGLYAQNLEALPKDDACALLLKIATRIGAEAEHIAQLCGHLPLTLTMAGSALAERIDLKPATYALRLEDGQTRLDMVAASFTLSYELLSEELRATWRRLAVFPNTFEVQGAAAVCGLERDVAEMQLSELVRYSLVEWDATAERHHFHDLARLFADSQLSDADRGVAQRWHAEYYKDVLSVADEFFLEGGETTTQGLALFDEELENIRAGQAWAADWAVYNDEVAQLCSDYAEAGMYCLDLRFHARDWICWLEAALAAARCLHDRQREASHLSNLGTAYRNLGDARRAITFYEQALVIEREIGNRRGEGKDLGNLGIACTNLGDARRAITFHEQALAISRETDNRRGEKNDLGNLGLAYSDLGEQRRAIKLYEQALAIAYEIDDRQGEELCLGNLGGAYKDLGDTRRAIKFFEQALAIAREIGDRRTEGKLVGNLGITYAARGDSRRTIEFFEQALTILQEVGDRRAEAWDCWNLGCMYEKQGDLERAAELMQISVDFEREQGHPDAEKDAQQLAKIRQRLTQGKKKWQFWKR
jgi:tetratricopeptide (TPR) repeat protein